MNVKAERLVADSAPNVREILRAVSELLVDGHGCTSYVKTIYVGFELNGQVCAAAYPKARTVEVALALPEEHESDRLVDATHLTWTTMPVSLVFEKPQDVVRDRALLDEAALRVRDGIHDVDLPQERFMGREKRLADRKILGPKDKRSS